MITSYAESAKALAAAQIACLRAEARRIDTEGGGPWAMLKAKILNLRADILAEESKRKAPLPEQSISRGDSSTEPPQVTSRA